MCVGEGEQEWRREIKRRKHAGGEGGGEEGCGKHVVRERPRNISGFIFILTKEKRRRSEIKTLLVTFFCMEATAEGEGVSEHRYYLYKTDKHHLIHQF